MPLKGAFNIMIFIFFGTFLFYLILDSPNPRVVIAVVFSATVTIFIEGLKSAGAQIL